MSVLVNETEIEDGVKENVIQAARRAGVEIPHYCWHEALSVVASCRMCLVEVGEKKPDGTVAMGPKLVPACQTPVKPGTVIRTDTPKVKAAQAMTLEFLLLNHPLDCSICDQAGECYLQDYTFKFGRAQSRLNEPKLQRMDKYHIGHQIALFTDRCVMCTRCVRFTREISGTAELQVVARGSHEEIDVFPGQPCDNKLAGNVVDLCPVGALCSKDFLYKKRVWWLKSQKSVCPGCSTGCSIEIDQNENHVYRLRPRANPVAQGHFICDEGRFGFKYVHDPRRLTKPWLKAGSNGQPTVGIKKNGDLPPDLAFIDPWPGVYQAVRERLQAAVAVNPSGLAFVFSPMMSVEEAFLLARLARRLDSRVRLMLGPVPTHGEDDRYPKRADGSGPAAGAEKFTIRAEKCPNRRGVEAVLKHYQGAVIPVSTTEHGHRDIHAWYLVGGYREGWVDQALEAAIGQPHLLIVQDIFPSPLSERADVVLAGGAFTERDGSFVSYKGVIQPFAAATRPPGSAKPDGRLLWELSGETGLFNASRVRQMVAAEIRAFAGLGNGGLGAQGQPLEARQEALV